MKEFRKKTETVDIEAKKGLIYLTVYFDNFQSFIVIVGDPKRNEKENKSIDMDAWHITDKDVMLEFMKGGVIFRIYLSRKEIEELFSVIFGEQND